jgi:parallel beta-helix repeat protein
VLLRIIIFLLLAPVIWAQNSYDSALTNKPIPYSSTILVPQAAAPDVTIPQAVDPNAALPPAPPAATAPATLPPSAQFRNLAPLPTGTPGMPPTAADYARHPLQIVPAPVIVPPVLLPRAVAQPANTNEIATPFGGKYYFVSSNGSDENNGGKTSSWKTLQQAANQVQPGDIVIVRPGIYEAFHTVHGGDSNRPITFRALGDAVIIPQGGDAPADQPLLKVEDLYRVDNIDIRSCDDIIIEGFQIQRAGRCGIFVEDSRGVILRNNTIGPVGRFGILTGFCVDLQIISNKTFGAVAEHGIYVSNSRATNNNPIVRFNESYGNRGAGIQVNGDCRSGGNGSITGARIENNVVHDNGLNGMSFISMSDSIVENNLVYHNGKFGGAGGMHFTDEVGCGHPSSGNVIVNNTVVEPSIVCVRFTQAAKDNIFFNNLLVGPRPLVDEVGDNKIAETSNIEVEQPLGVFNNPDANDYRLLPTSPARNVGLAAFKDQPAPTTDRDGKVRQTVLSHDSGAY